MNQVSLSQKAVTSVRWTALNTFFQISFQFLTLVVLGRLLSPRAFGLMAMIMVVVEIVNIFARMGLSEAIIFKQKTSVEELSTLYFLNMGVGFFLFALVYFGSGLIAGLYATPELVPLIKIISLIFFIAPVGILFEILLRKNLMFDQFAKINITSVCVAFVVMTLMAMAGFGVLSLIFGLLLSQILKSFQLFFIGMKNNWLPQMQFNLKGISFYLTFGMYRILGMSLNQLNSRIDQVLIGSMLGPVPLGFYNIAFRVIYMPVQTLNPILTQVAFPFFASIQDENVRLKKNYLKYINLILSINTPFMVVVAALAHLLIPAVLGDQWTASVPIIQALVFYVYIRSIFNASGSLMMAKGKADWSFYMSVALVFVIPGVTYLVIKNTGSVIFVAAALGVIFFFLFFVHYELFLRTLLGGFFREYMLALARPLFLSLGLGGMLYAFSFVLNSLPDILSILILFLMGIAFYFILSVLFNSGFIEELENVAPVVVRRLICLARCKIQAYTGLTKKVF